MKYHSKSVFDYPFSFQGVYLLIKYANFDSTVQRESFWAKTGKKLAQPPDYYRRLSQRPLVFPIRIQAK